MRAFNLSAWGLRHPQFVFFLMMMLAVAGGLAYVRLGRAEDPDFTIKNVNVSAVWPGASAEEMRDQVGDVIERKLQELPYADHLETYAKPGFLSITFVFKDSTPPKEVAGLFVELRKKMRDVSADLPPGAIGPTVNDEFGDVDNVLYAIRAPGLEPSALKTVGEALRKALQRVPDVKRVDLVGDRGETVFVEFSQTRLATLGVPLPAILDALVKRNALAPAGEFQTAGDRIPLRLSGAPSGVAEIADTPVVADGRTFRLGDVADVKHGYEDPPSFLVRSQGEPAVEVGVVMQPGADILALGKRLDAAVADFERNLPEGVTVARIADQPRVVGAAVFEFTRSFLEALVIVLAVSLFSLGWRSGLVVAISVPLVLAIVFLVMQAMGLALQRVSLGALIIALGLLVDDAIIAVEMIAVKLAQGWSRERAASFAWDSTAFPMLTGTLVTAAGFMPVGFAASTTGEYTNGIFWVVGAALLASWAVAVLFTPLIGARVMKAEAGHARSERDIYETRLYRAFRGALEFSVRRPGVVIAVAAGLMALGLSQFARVQQQFFPMAERPELFFEIRLPEGAAIAATDKAAKEGEALVAGDADAASYTTYVGKSSPRFWLGLLPVQPNESFAQIVVVAKDVAARERLRAKILAAVDRGALSQARVRVDRFNFGPPVGFPVQFRVTGPDGDKLPAIAERVRAELAADPRAVGAHIDWGERMPSYRLDLDEARTRALGLSREAVAQSLQAVVSGVTVTHLREGTESVPVVARAVAAERGAPDRIGDIVVANAGGAPVTVSQVARTTLASEDPILWRRNREPVMTVRADVVDGAQPPDVSNAVKARLKPIVADLPPGYRIDMGGAVEEAAKGNASLAAVFPAMILVMLTILMTQMQNFSRLAVVFFTAPLGIVGASVALSLTHRPFGFVALLGLIALAGMDMRNTVILVDQIESDVKERGLTRREAIVSATLRRARPVALTALTAILAMIPLSESAFWGPMATTIMGGLSVATVLTLFVTPAIYALWFRRSLGPTPSSDAKSADAGTLGALAPAG